MNILQHNVKQKHSRLYQRIAKAIQTGKFTTYTAAKKQAIYQRFKRYESRLKGWGIAVASATALLFSPVTADAQVFVEHTGANNPLDFAWYYFTYSTPTFVDIDADGDFDCFAGTGSPFSPDVYYFKNIGTSTNPVFTYVTGVDDPFGGFDEVAQTTIDFVDIDADGDFDAFMGDWWGDFYYFENTGTASSPVFTPQTGGSNPLNGYSLGRYSAPAFVDIDDDGDFDCFSGKSNQGWYLPGIVHKYINLGTSTSPNFDYLGPEYLGVGGSWQDSKPEFVDFDNDGDFDLFMGDYDGTIRYFKNTGSPTSADFTQQTGTDNPFDGIVMMNSYNSKGASVPALVDIDGDGDLDAFIGEWYGNINFYKNVPSALPVELTTFTGEATKNGNFLKWTTAAEENNAGFEIQKSTDGRTFEKIAFVEGSGTTVEQQHYEFLDTKNLSGLNTEYYRLKQMDFNGKFEYSNIVSISNNKAATAEMSFYPNPVKDLLTIENGEGTAIIYNALGQPLQQFEITNTKYFLNTNELPKGIYTLQVRKTDGTTTIQQFVK
jgi:hypothetical protein